MDGFLLPLSFNMVQIIGQYNFDDKWTHEQRTQFASQSCFASHVFLVHKIPFSKPLLLHLQVIILFLCQLGLPKMLSYLMMHLLLWDNKFFKYWPCDCANSSIWESPNKMSTGMFTSWPNCNMLGVHLVLWFTVTGAPFPTPSGTHPNTVAYLARNLALADFISRLDCLS